MTEIEQRKISPLNAGLRLRCPHCGVGKLYKGYLKLDDACGNCDQDFSHADTADGPAVFVMLIAGIVILFSALFVEVNYRPPYWVHILAWLPLTILLPLLLLPFVKSILFAFQFRLKALEARHDTDVQNHRDVE